MIKVFNNSYSTSSLKSKSIEALTRFFSRKDIGFKSLAVREELWQQVAARASSLESNKYQAIAIIGIGGSSLGIEAIYHALLHKTDKLVVFFDSPDELATSYKWQQIANKKTHFIVISKSGKTLEALALTSWLSEQGVNFSSDATVVTEPQENPLSNWAKKNNVTQLEIPVDVGGRFSVLSPVGMFPAAMMGLDIEKFRVGAESAIKETDLIADLMASSLESFKDNKWLTQLWIYSQPLKSFGLWWQQLWAESLAKKKTITGDAALRVSTPMVCVGPNDQHSLLQQVVEGHGDKWLVFLKPANPGNQVIKASSFEGMDYLNSRTLGDILEVECMSTMNAVKEYGVPTLGLEIETLGEENLGYLFMFFQLLVAGLGEQLNIDAFNQPGVELSKKLAREKLQN